MNSLSAVLHGRLAVLHQGAAEISLGHGPAHSGHTAHDTQTLGRGAAVTACPAHSAAADGLEPCALHMGVIKRIKSA